MMHGFEAPTTSLRAAALMALALVAGLIAPRTAGAGQLIPLTIEEMAAVSDTVVHATVTDSQPVWYEGMLITIHDLEVEEALKGSAGEDLQAWTFGGSYGALGSASPGMATMRPGEEVIVFLETPDISAAKAAGREVDEKSPMNNLPTVIGGYQGKFIVQTVSEELPVGPKTLTRERELVRRQGGTRLAAEELPTLEQFKSAVRTVAAEGAPVKKSSRRVGGKTVEVAPADPDATALRIFDPLRSRADGRKNLVPIGKVSTLPDDGGSQNSEEED